MIRMQAILLDRQGTYYSTLDGKTNLWGVFGSVSGFCYFTYTDEHQAWNMVYDLIINDEIFNADCKRATVAPPPLPTRKELALKKIRELAKKAGPVPSGMLCISEEAQKTDGILKRISRLFSKPKQ